MDAYDIFKYDLKGQSGGMLIVDTVNSDKIIILGKSNIPKRAKEYESFGGKVEKYDLSSLHTAIRETVEEFFNVKIEQKHIDRLAYDFRMKGLIVGQYEYFGMSYLINFYGLNEIFIKLCEVDTNFLKYKINDVFDLEQYIADRIVVEKSKNGLNEIVSIHVFRLSDVKKNKIKLRWFTNKIIWKML